MLRGLRFGRFFLNFKCFESRIGLLDPSRVGGFRGMRVIMLASHVGRWRKLRFIMALELNVELWRLID